MSGFLKKYKISAYLGLFPSTFCILQKSSLRFIVNSEENKKPSCSGKVNMRELFSAFSATVFYPLVALVLPGLTAISGWFLYLVEEAALKGMVSRNHTETSFILMLLSIFVGTVIDDLGMRIETLWLDHGRERRTNGSHSQEWWAYLRKPFAIEPSGRRHLRRLVARLKFELGVPTGFVITLPSLWINSTVPYHSAFIVSFIGSCVSIYLLYESTSTHEILGQLRHELLKEEGSGYVVVTRKTVQSA